MPSFELTIAYYRGRELNPRLEQVSQKFLLDDKFVKSRAFCQFVWRTNMIKFEERCNKLRIEHPKLEEAALQNQIKEQMIQEF